MVAQHIAETERQIDDLVIHHIL